MDNKDQKNFVLAIGITLLIMLAAQMFLWGPNEEKRQAEAARIQAQARPEVSQPVVDAPRDRAEVIAESAANDVRVPFDAPGVDGTILLKGARFDDLNMKRHFETVDLEEEEHLLSPRGSQNAFYTVLGWGGDIQGLPNASTNWQLTSGSTLTPDTPIVLSHEGGDLVFKRTISVDNDYMFTVTDQVVNQGDASALIRPIGVVRQHGLPDGWKPFYILHEGAIGVAGTKLKQQKYKSLDKGKGLSFSSMGGWIGLTTKYWMTAIVPQQNDNVTVDARFRREGTTGYYETQVTGEALNLAPGSSLTYATRVFAGAKRVKVLEGYQKDTAFDATGRILQPIPRFTDAVDWGNFWFFTKPFFWLLSKFNDWFGNFGLAIMALTVLVKLAFFPIQNTAYASMAKMRKIMPEMEEIKERFAADKQRQQQEIMALYQREKANPFAGCLPLLPQMFVFYGLYKTLFVTLEMRHQSFGYISDLSAPDPSSVLNLGGLIPWDPASIPLAGVVLGIGFLPVMYGVTMWALQSLNAPPPDPTQRMMMQYLPLIFTFIFAGFAAGLVLYWTWSNVLSIAQQYFIMRQNGVETQLDKWLKNKFGSQPDKIH